MIVWSNPVALAGLVLLAGPVVVHLLLRHRAPRIRFPSLRFVRASRPAAVRLRLPSDTVLLLIRLAIVALAVFALAQPLLFTRARVSAWNARTARAVVVDSSESMRPLESLSAEAARAERGSAAFTFEIADGNLGKGMLRAAEALRHAPPARGEIVVVSDFQWGSIRPSDLQMIPPEIGLRFIRVGTDGMKRRTQAVSVVGATADEQQESSSRRRRPDSRSLRRRLRAKDWCCGQHSLMREQLPRFTGSSQRRVVRRRLRRSQ